MTVKSLSELSLSHVCHARNSEYSLGVDLEHHQAQRLQAPSMVLAALARWFSRLLLTQVQIYISKFKARTTARGLV